MAHQEEKDLRFAMTFDFLIIKSLNGLKKYLLIGLFLVVGQKCFSQGGDTCVDAEFVSDITCFDFDLDGMTTSSVTAPSCIGVQYIDVWFKGIVGNTGSVTFTGQLPFTGGFAYITIYTGDCSMLNEIACQLITFPNPSLTLSQPVGTELIVRITKGGGGNDLSGTFCSTGLPVTWLKPTKADIKDGKTVITFSTAQQINNSFFEIEYSQDGRTYQTIGKINGEVNSNSEIDYEFIHNTPSFGINYYRVKQVDLDGQYSFSNVASLIYRTDEVNVYPNPVRDLLTINLPNESSILEYNHLGQQIGKYKLAEGENTMDLTGMDSGLYLLKFSDGTMKRVMKR